MRYFVTGATGFIGAEAARQLAARGDEVVAVRAPERATYLGSNAKAKRDLGYDPRPLEQGLPPTLAWEMEQAGVKPAR